MSAESKRWPALSNLPTCHISLVAPLVCAALKRRCNPVHSTDMPLLSQAAKRNGSCAVSEQVLSQYAPAFLNTAGACRQPSAAFPLSFGCVLLSQRDGQPCLTYLRVISLVAGAFDFSFGCVLLTTSSGRNVLLDRCQCPFPALHLCPFAAVRRHSARFCGAGGARSGPPLSTVTVLDSVRVRGLLKSADVATWTVLHHDGRNHLAPRCICTTLSRGSATPLGAREWSVCAPVLFCCCLALPVNRCQSTAAVPSAERAQLALHARGATK